MSESSGLYPIGYGILHNRVNSLSVRAAELAEEGGVRWEDAWTFLDLAERSRALTEKYFKVRL